MLSGKVTADTEKQFKENLCRYAKEYGNIRIIGSGGNINKLNKLARHNKTNGKELTLSELKRLYQMMQPLSIEEREISFSLKEDRADVIIPAAEISSRPASIWNATPSWCRTSHLPTALWMDCMRSIETF